LKSCKVKPLRHFDFILIHALDQFTLTLKPNQNIIWQELQAACVEEVPSSSCDHATSIHNVSQHRQQQDGCNQPQYCDLVQNAVSNENQHDEANLDENCLSILHSCMCEVQGSLDDIIGHE
jgi:hypothetical protein